MKYLYLKRKKICSFILISLLFLFLPISQVLGQEIIGIEYEDAENSTKLVSENSFENIVDFEIIWVNNNSLLYQDNRFASIVMNPTSKENFIKKPVFNFIWALGKTYSHYTYIEELELVLLAVETPARLEVYDSKGRFLEKEVCELIETVDYRAEYVRSRNEILVLANYKLFYYDNETENIDNIMDNVFDYTYYPETDEILILQNVSEQTENGRRAFNAHIIKAEDKEIKYSIDDVTDLKYLPQANKVFYAKRSATHNAEFKEVSDYPNDKESTQTISENLAYHDFLNKDRYKNIEMDATLKNNVAFDYSHKTNLYMWSETDSPNSDLNEVVEKTFNISKKNEDGSMASVKTIEGIIDYAFNEKTNDVILFYENGGNYKIEKMSLDKLDEKPITITEQSIKTNENFKWFKERNILTFLENEGGDTYIKVFDADNNEVVDKWGAIDPNKRFFVELTEGKTLSVSYIDNSGIAKTELYYIPKGIRTTFPDNTYYAKPNSATGDVAIIGLVNKSADDDAETVNNEGDASSAENEKELVIGFYKSNVKYKKKPPIFGPYGIGLKMGVGINSMLVTGNTPDFGFDISIFGNVEIAKVWMIELSFAYAHRYLSFSEEKNSGLANDVRVDNRLLSISVLGRYMLPTLYIPFGLRGDFNLYSIGTLKSNTGAETDFSFKDNVNTFSLNLVAGAGLNFPLSKKMDLFTELLVVFNAFPSFFKPNFTTGETDDTQKNGHYLGFILNVGLTMYKFGLLDEKESPPLPFGPFGLGVKMGGAISTMFVTGSSADFSYEPMFIFNVGLPKSWLLEFGLGFNGRYLSFDSDRNEGLTNDIRINVNVLSISVLGKYMFPLFYIPFGIRANVTLSSVGEIIQSGGTSLEFSFEETNPMTFDITAGGGINFALTDKMDLFTELLLVFNVVPALLKPCLVTGETDDTRIDGRYFAVQLNVGLTFFKFGEDKNESESKKTSEIGPFGVGLKAGGNLNSMFVPASKVYPGFEFSVFGSMSFLDNWMIELAMLIGRRNETFDKDTAGLTGDKTVIGSTITGLQLSGRYTFDILKKGLNLPKSIGIYIPFGLRANFNLDSKVYVDDNPAYSFDSVNGMSTDLLAGVGYIYYISEKMDISAELLFILNLSPTFYKSSFVTGDDSGSASQIDGRYWGLQLNIGFTAWKF